MGSKFGFENANEEHRRMLASHLELVSKIDKPLREILEDFYFHVFEVRTAKILLEHPPHRQGCPRLLPMSMSPVPFYGIGLRH